MDKLISSQAAIDAVHKDYDVILDFKSNGHTIADSFEDIINALPPALPRKSKWIWDGDSTDWEREYICRECKCYALEKDGNQIRSNFCPNCGADMR